MRYLTILILVVFAACNEEPANTSDPDFKNEMADREVKKVSDGAITDAAFQKGQYIADSAQKLLGAALKNAIATEGVIGAVEYCNISAFPLMETASKNMGAKVKRVSLKLRNPNDAPDPMEKQILEAYDYQIENGLELQANVQKDGEYLLFTKPITIQSGLCLNCHGSVGQEVNTDTYEAIKKLYPQDDATGHKMGDLRGMWSIRLSKKELIKAL